MTQSSFLISQIVDHLSHNHYMVTLNQCLLLSDVGDENVAKLHQDALTNSWIHAIMRRHHRDKTTRCTDFIEINFFDHLHHNNYTFGGLSPVLLETRQFCRRFHDPSSRAAGECDQSEATISEPNLASQIRSLFWVLQSISCYCQLFHSFARRPIHSTLGEWEQ